MKSNELPTHFCTVGLAYARRLAALGTAFSLSLPSTVPPDTLQSSSASAWAKNSL